MNGDEGKSTNEDAEVHFSVGPREREHIYKGTHVVLGATGVGKTTLINFMTKQDSREMKGHGAGVDSKTRECMIVESGRMTINDERVELKFLDSVGFDAADVNSEELFCAIVEQIVRMGDPRIHSVILVLKMERFRSNFWADLGKVLKMFGLFDIKKENILLVITHSSLCTDEVQETYRKELHDKLKDHVLLDNIMHINFIKAEEVRPQLRSYYRDLVQSEFQKLAQKLVQFKRPFNPQRYFYKKMNLKQNIKKDMSGLNQNVCWTWLSYIFVVVLAVVTVRVYHFLQSWAV
mmetsp:Transcript_28365/g.45639  ORF Transcript_28365/g.45639 Transcript_28365/m.45639 type:complete len:292 (-) Transcript_28365:116-991(-)